ncbi:hypothetical protein ACVRXQ_12150 [Streptococcus panodentis]|uniref:Phage protein n=1 Tax=Streptococcus panodentis TaxID=1581472 RepID=A0ABS5AXX7_9STRE|nr:hypothetical protein [Streptococcus panodentis]MBP2621116.1 hypothetical protein [Streptococcus panodentis]
MTFEVKDVSRRYGENGEVTQTIVNIYQATPYFATASYPLDGDHTSKDKDDLLALVKAEFFKEQYTAYAHKELEKKVQSNAANLEDVQAVANRVDRLSELVIGYLVANGDVPQTTYTEIAKVLPALVTNKRYGNGDLIAMPYHADGNAKWPKGTPTIYRFAMAAGDGYTYKSQTVEKMVQDGVLSVIVPKLN